VAFFFAAREVTRRVAPQEPGDKQGASATAIAIGALMDGIPESAAIGISLLEGGKISAALVAAVRISRPRCTFRAIFAVIRAWTGTVFDV
jgi:ZIP family zinc transporter